MAGWFGPFYIHELNRRTETAMTCETCGRVFDGKTSRARFCSSACRGRAARQRTAPTPTPGSQVAASVTEALRRMRQLDTPSGQQAVALAQRIDAGTDVAAGLAACSRQLQALLKDAQHAAYLDDDDDPIAQLRQRRDERRHEYDTDS